MKWTKEGWYLACLKSARDSALNGVRLAAEISPVALEKAKAITLAYEEAIKELQP